jgi:hypothetical protein
MRVTCGLCGLGLVVDERDRYYLWPPRAIEYYVSTIVRSCTFRTTCDSTGKSELNISS